MIDDDCWSGESGGLLTLRDECEFTGVRELLLLLLSTELCPLIIEFPPEHKPCDDVCVGIPLVKSNVVICGRFASKWLLVEKRQLLFPIRLLLLPHDCKLIDSGMKSGGGVWINPEVGNKLEQLVKKGEWSDDNIRWFKLEMWVLPLHMGCKNWQDGKLEQYVAEIPTGTELKVKKNK